MHTCYNCTCSLQKMNIIVKKNKKNKTFELKYKHTKFHHATFENRNIPKCMMTQPK